MASRPALCWIVAAVLTPGCGTSESDDTSSGPSTTGTASGPTATGADDTLSGSGSGSTASGSAGQDSGGVDGGQLPPGEDCVVDSDCIIDDDCCHCIAYGELPPTHECKFDTCEVTDCDYPYGGLPPQPACVNGNCFIAHVDCDPGHATCGSPAPECQDLERPAVVDGCWGPCVPQYVCAGFLYPGASCPDGYVEVRWSSCSGDVCNSATSCEPDPGGCGDTLTCDCGIEAICDSDAFSCFDPPSGAVCCIGDPAACQAAG